MKLKSEAEKEKSKLDPWKLKHFEPIWGDKGDRSGTSSGTPVKNELTVQKQEPTTIKSELEVERPALKTTIKLRPTTSIASSSTATPGTFTSNLIKTSPVKSSPPNTCISPKRTRTAGAITRATAVLHHGSPIKSASSVPDLLPIRTKINTKSLLTVAADSSSITTNDTVKHELVDETDMNDRLSYQTNHLKRTLSIDQEESHHSKVMKTEQDETLSIEITSYDMETKSEIQLQESTSMDSEQYSEGSNPNLNNFIYDESSATNSDHKSNPVSNFSDNSQLENLNEADLFYKSDKSTDDPSEQEQLQMEQIEETVPEAGEEIQYIYQNDVSCGANEDIGVTIEANSNSSNSNISSNQINLNSGEMYPGAFHQVHSLGDGKGATTNEHIDNQIEIVSCDNMNEMVSETLTQHNPNEAIIQSGQHMQQQHQQHQLHHHHHHQRLGDATTMEELGISVHNEEVVTDQDEADELIPSIQNIQNIPLDDPDQIDEHLTDAVNYVLESGEITDENDTSKKVFFKLMNET